MDIPTSFVQMIFVFDEAFKYSDGAQFWGYVGTNAEALCVGFCNFVHCKLFNF
jgi:hypothetical protein